MIIFSEWPMSGPVVVGILVGIRLLFLGNSMIMIGSGLEYAAKNSPVDTTAEAASDLSSEENSESNEADDGDAVKEEV